MYLALDPYCGSDPPDDPTAKTDQEKFPDTKSFLEVVGSICLLILDRINQFYRRLLANAKEYQDNKRTT